jgi:hypothetical protein
LLKPSGRAAIVVPDNVFTKPAQHREFVVGCSKPAVFTLYCGFRLAFSTLKA